MTFKSNPWRGKKPPASQPDQQSLQALDVAGVCTADQQPLQALDDQKVCNTTPEGSTKLEFSSGKIGAPNTDTKTERQEVYLRGFLNGGVQPLPYSQAALELAIRAHGHTRRDDGSLYISHPIGMACDAIGMGIRDDSLIATILLHDVCEDCNIPTQNVSESSVVRNAVRYMTIQARSYDMTKADVQRRYFEELLESREALLCKVFDRIHNVESSVGVFTAERALKQWRETYHLLLPVTTRAKQLWPTYSDALHVLRGRLRNNLNWAQKYYKFTELQLYTPYGEMDFERRTPKS